ncbi:MAG: zinc ribbon domain-containing protein [Thermoprotei archaeon]
MGDVSFYAFKQELEWKAEKCKNVVKIGRFDPSSKLCSNCGNAKRDLKLSARIRRCEACGLIIDKDYNASKNIRKLGLIEVGPVRSDLRGATLPARYA